MQTISKCPVCKSEDLEQEFVSRQSNGRIGGSSYSSSATLDGCSCNSCGVQLKFNKKGECPNCKGTGQFTRRHYIGGREQTDMGVMSSECPTCNGSGKIE